MKIRYAKEYENRVRTCFPEERVLLEALTNGGEEFGKMLARRISNPPENLMLVAVIQHDSESMRSLGDQYREAANLLAEWIETYKPVGYKIPVFV